MQTLQTAVCIYMVTRSEHGAGAGRQKLPLAAMVWTLLTVLSQYPCIQPTAVVSSTLSLFIVIPHLPSHPLSCHTQ